MSGDACSGCWSPVLRAPVAPPKRQRCACGILLPHGVVSQADVERFAVQVARVKAVARGAQATPRLDRLVSFAASSSGLLVPAASGARGASVERPAVARVPRPGFSAAVARRRVERDGYATSEDRPTLVIDAPVVVRPRQSPCRHCGRRVEPDQLQRTRWSSPHYVCTSCAGSAPSICMMCFEPVGPEELHKHRRTGLWTCRDGCA